MTETRLRTWTHSGGYGLAALFVLILALQNLRYGFYDLFYLALVMSLLLLAGLIYTLFSRRQQLSAPGHSIILAATSSLLVAAALVMKAPGLSHWSMPLIMLNLLILPLRRGVVLSCLLIIPSAILAWHSSPAADALFTTTGLILLLAVTALYVWHYDHMAQSAQDLALTDPVTGAQNPRFLDENLQKEISRSMTTGHPLSLICLGLDHSAEIQKLHGTGGLQTLLRNMTRELFAIIRAGDSLYSTSDSEFFLILPFTPEEGVRVIAERIRRIISEQDWPAVGIVSISLGCTTRIDEDTRADTLRARAEQAMAEARQRNADTAWFSQGETSRA